VATEALKLEPVTGTQRLGWHHLSGGELVFVRADGRCHPPELTGRIVPFDLPPGLAGFSNEIMLLVGNLSPRRPMPPGYPTWEDLEFRVNMLALTARLALRDGQPAPGRVDAVEAVRDVLALHARHRSEASPTAARSPSRPPPARRP